MRNGQGANLTRNMLTRCEKCQSKSVVLSMLLRFASVVSHDCRRVSQGRSIARRFVAKVQCGGGGGGGAGALSRWDRHDPGVREMPGK